MQSLALLGGFGASDPRVGPAKADQSALPLGMIWAKSTHGGPSNGAASTRPAAVAAPTRPPLPTPGGCPPQLPPPPAGPPVLVLFPATLHLAVFFSPPPLGTLAAVVLALMGLFGSWAWGWGLVSTAGIFSGLVAGFVVGLGVRARPVEGWGCISLVREMIFYCWWCFFFVKFFCFVLFLLYLFLNISCFRVGVFCREDCCA